MMKLVWGLWALLFMAVVSACSTTGAVTSDPQSSDVPVAAGAAITASPHLYILEGGIIARPLDNGAAVPIAKEVSAEIYLAPYPPKFYTRVDLYLYEPRSGAPIKDAEVIINYEMLYMDHGLYKLNAFDNGNGHYQALLDFDMYGEYVVDVYVQNGEQDGSVRLEIVF